MPTVNLSRLHSMIKNAANEIRQIQNDIASSKGSFEFTILRATTDEDLQEFRERIAAKRNAMLEMKKRLMQWLEYGNYLKKILDEENRKNGIAQKLLELSDIQRKQAELDLYRRQVAPFCADQWQIDKPAEYYKSAFTETSPVFQLYVSLFNSDYPEKLKMERDGLEARRQELDDDLASLNQMTAVTIESPSDFMKRNFG